MTIRVAVAGLGRIGCGYDLAHPAPDRPSTHMGALFDDARFKVIAAADPDPEKRRLCEEKWPDTYYTDDLTASIKQLEPDVVCIATPATERADLISSAAEANVGIIFCEKPLAPIIAEAEHIASIVRKSGSKLVVNFSRRWEPGCQQAATLLQNGEIGDIELVRCLYTRGVSNNGSHLVDLLRWWFGEIEAPAVGRIRDTETVDFEAICGDRIPVEVRAMDGRAYDLFRLEAFGTEGTLLLDDFGERLTVRMAEALAADPDLRVLGPGQQLTTDPLAPMTAAWNNIHDCLTQDALPKCDLEDGLAVARICGAIETAMRQ